MTDQERRDELTVFDLQSSEGAGLKSLSRKLRRSRSGTVCIAEGEARALAWILEHSSFSTTGPRSWEDLP